MFLVPRPNRASNPPRKMFYYKKKAIAYKHVVIRRKLQHRTQLKTKCYYNVGANYKYKLCIGITVLTVQI